jgi:hypothetical protein
VEKLSRLRVGGKDGRVSSLYILRLTMYIVSVHHNVMTPSMSRRRLAFELRNGKSDMHKSQKNDTSDEA